MTSRSHAASPGAVTRAIDRMLAMGAPMAGKLLNEAAEAHHKARGGMDAKLVTTEADYTVVSAAFGKAIASVPSSQVRGVYNSFAKLVSGSVSNKLSSTVNPAEAVKAYDGLITVTDTVKAARR